MICLFLFGLYYAATEGVLRAMASGVIPAEYRSSGLAFLGTFVGLGKFISSVLFGWLWQTWGTQAAVTALGIGLLIALPFAVQFLRNSNHAKLA